MWLNRPSYSSVKVQEFTKFKDIFLTLTLETEEWSTATGIVSLSYNRHCSIRNSPLSPPPSRYKRQKILTCKTKWAAGYDQLTKSYTFTLKSQEAQQRIFSCLPTIIPPLKKKIKRKIIKSCCFPQQICITKSKENDEETVNEIRCGTGWGGTAVRDTVIKLRCPPN